MLVHVTRDAGVTASILNVTATLVITIAKIVPIMTQVYFWSLCSLSLGLFRFSIMHYLQVSLGVSAR